MITFSFIRASKGRQTHCAHSKFVEFTVMQNDGTAAFGGLAAKSTHNSFGLCEHSRHEKPFSNLIEIFKDIIFVSTAPLGWPHHHWSPYTVLRMVAEALDTHTHNLFVPEKSFLCWSFSYSVASGCFSVSANCSKARVATRTPLKWQLKWKFVIAFTSLSLMIIINHVLCKEIILRSSTQCDTQFAQRPKHISFLFLKRLAVFADLHIFEFITKQVGR